MSRLHTAIVAVNRKECIFALDLLFLFRPAFHEDGIGKNFHCLKALCMKLCDKRAFPASKGPFTSDLRQIMSQRTYEIRHLSRQRRSGLNRGSSTAWCQLEPLFHAGGSKSGFHRSHLVGNGLEDSGGKKQRGRMDRWTRVSICVSSPCVYLLS